MDEGCPGMQSKLSFLVQEKKQKKHFPPENKGLRPTVCNFTSFGGVFSCNYAGPCAR